MWRAIVLLCFVAPAWADDVDVARLRADVTHLCSDALAGRNNGTPGGAATRDWLIARYKALGLEPAGQKGAWTQEFRGLGKRGQTPGFNVLARLPGSDERLREEVIIVAAHFDHLGTIKGEIYRGANDNACGVAVTLELARLWAKDRPKRTIVFANWDAEEDGLVGSRHFVASPTLPLKTVAAYIDMDLIGRDLLDILPKALLVFGAESADGMTAALKIAAAGKPLDLYPFGADMVGPRCDFWNFRGAGIPAMFFTCGEHDDYHTTRDVVGTIKFDKVTRIAEILRGTVRRLADAPRRPTHVAKPRYAREEATKLGSLITAIRTRGNVGRTERWVLGRAQGRLAAMGKGEGPLGTMERNYMRALVAWALIRRRVVPFVEKK